MSTPTFLGTPTGTIGGASVWELKEGFAEGIGDQGPFATKAWLCYWADRYAVCNNLLGFTRAPGAVGGAFSFATPAQYAESANLYAREIAIAPAGKVSQGGAQVAFDVAKVTARYGIPRFGFTRGDDPAGLHSIDPATPFVFAEQSIEFSGEFLTIPGSACQLAGGTAVDFDSSIFVPHANLTLKLMACPFLPAQAILTALGKINNATFLGCATGKVRFNGARTQRSAASDGTITQSLEYSFSYRDIASWDKTFHPNGTTGWVQLQDKNGSPIVASATLANLIPSQYFA